MACRQHPLAKSIFAQLAPYAEQDCKTILATSWENLFMPYANNKD